MAVYPVDDTAADSCDVGHSLRGPAAVPQAEKRRTDGFSRIADICASSCYERYGVGLYEVVLGLSCVFFFVCVTLFFVSSMTAVEELCKESDHRARSYLSISVNAILFGFSM